MSGVEHLYGENPEIGFLVPTKVEMVSGGGLEPQSLRKPEPQRKTDPVLKQTARRIEKIDFDVPDGLVGAHDVHVRTRYTPGGKLRTGVMKDIFPPQPP